MPSQSAIPTNKPTNHLVNQSLHDKASCNIVYEHILQVLPAMAYKPYTFSQIKQQTNKQSGIGKQEKNK